MRKYKLISALAEETAKEVVRNEETKDQASGSKFIKFYGKSR